MRNIDIQNLIVKKTNEIASNDFLSNYDPSCPMDIFDSITYLLMEQINIENLDSSEVYDFLKDLNK